MRTVRRLRLRCFSFNIFSDELSTSILVTLSKPSHPHHKKTWTQKNIISSVTTIIVICIAISLWWRWGESNSRPEYVSSCFKQPYHYYTLYILTKQIKLLLFSLCPILLNSNHVHADRIDTYLQLLQL